MDLHAGFGDGRLLESEVRSQKFSSVVVAGNGGAMHQHRWAHGSLALPPPLPLPSPLAHVMLQCTTAGGGTGAQGRVKISDGCTEAGDDGGLVGWVGAGSRDYQGRA